MTQQGMDKINGSLDRIEVRMDDINRVLGEIMDILEIDKSSNNKDTTTTTTTYDVNVKYNTK